MKTSQHIRLGLLVLVATALLVAGLYYVGRQRNIFRSTATMHAKFGFVDGLMPGNNVRYNGYILGMVLDVVPVNDTVIDVLFSVDESMLQWISINSTVILGTDGLLGNKLLEIEPGHPFQRCIENGDTLLVRKQVAMDQAMRTLNETNNNLLLISDDLKSISTRFSRDNSLWQLLADTALSPQVRSAVMNIEIASDHTASLTKDLRTMVSDVKSGRGSIGALIVDTSLYATLHRASNNFESISDTLTSAGDNFNQFTRRTMEGKGNLATFINDTTLVPNMNSAVGEIGEAAASLDETLTLLQQSRLMKRYFKRQTKQRKQQ